MYKREIRQLMSGTVYNKGYLVYSYKVNEMEKIEYREVVIHVYVCTRMRHMRKHELHYNVFPFLPFTLFKRFVSINLSFILFYFFYRTTALFASMRCFRKTDETERKNEVVDFYTLDTKLRNLFVNRFIYFLLFLIQYTYKETILMIKSNYEIFCLYIVSLIDFKQLVRLIL